MSELNVIFLVAKKTRVVDDIFEITDPTNTNNIYINNIIIGTGL